MGLVAWLAAALMPCLTGGNTLGAEGTSQEKNMLNLVLRSRTESPKGSGRFEAAETKAQWESRQTAAVVCDMWDQHWCKGATGRVAVLAPRMNELLTELRKRGVLIIHAPSGTLKAYSDHPGRKLAQSAPKVETPAPLQEWVNLDPKREGRLPIDDSDGGCACEPRCKEATTWRKQVETIEIKDGDAITDSAEAFYLMKQRGITNVIVMGVHLNMCMLGRPFSIRQLVLQGQNVVLVRDLTDTMYNPRMKPQVDHFSGTDLVVEHIERYWCPSITSDQLIGGKPFRFAADKRPLGPDGSPRRIPSKTEVEPDYAHPSPEAMERWYDLKYGFRIHWGLYAIKPVGPESWPLTKNGMEFMEWYHQQCKTWNPAGFNADDWIAFMRRGGMKFFVFTTKHHEGFCMFDTRTRVRKRFVYSGPNAGSIEDCDLAYGIMDTPFKRDVVKELVDAARKGGIVPGLYFSHPDWYDADFRIDQWNPMKRFMKNIQYTRENDPEAWDRMVKRHREQIREILTNYGPISEASLDMSMPDSFWPDMVETIKMARRLQPDCLFRNRGIGPYGDYHTPEGWIPDSPKSRESSTPWQVIYPLARWFSYDPEDKAYKPGSWIVYNVVDITAKGGLFMVGFGPDGDGKFHPKAVEAVEYAGDWLEVNGEAIYGTRPWTYWKEGDDVRFTRTKDNRFVYAISLKWPGDALTLRSLRAKEGSAVTLLGFKEPLKWRNDGERGLVIEIPKELQDEAKRPCKQAYAFKIEDWRDDRGGTK